MSHNALYWGASWHPGAWANQGAATMFARFAFPLMLVVGIVALPVRALACTNDIDCGGCGLICSWAVTPHVCITAADNPTDPGWCGQNSDCACPGQTCVGTSCSPSYDS